jgi:hypothetical protein
MRERVALVAGELRTGRRPGGGYEVRAWLPLDGHRRGARRPGAPGDGAGPRAGTPSDLSAELHRSDR